MSSSCYFDIRMVKSRITGKCGDIAVDPEKIENHLTKINGNAIIIFDTKAHREEKEIFYHGILLGLLRCAQNWLIQSNAESGDGFAGILIEPEDPDSGIIIELKYSQTFSGLEKYSSVIQYNNENSLSSVLTIAYLSAMQFYFKPIRELPTGRGFADFVFIPKPEYMKDYPALVVELKWNQNAQTAMQQIKERNYPMSIEPYTGNILLVAINYDKTKKSHQCMIEKYIKKK